MSESVQKCAECGLSPSKTEFGTVHGKLRSVCKNCRNLADRVRRAKKSKPRSVFMSQLISMNQNRLLTLPEDDYLLLDFHSGEPKGLFCLRHFVCGVVTHELGSFSFDVENIALYLSKKGLVLGSQPICLDDDINEVDDVSESHTRTDAVLPPSFADTSG